METLGNPMATFGNQNDNFTEEIFCCNICDYTCSKKYNYNRHMANGKHKMPQNGNFCQLLATFGNQNDKNDKNDKNEQIFYCKYCHYKSSIKCNYERHIKTLSHLRNEQNDKNEQLKNEQNEQNDKNEEQKNYKFQCICGKKYKDKSGLWKHKNKCIHVSNSKNQIVKYEDSDDSSSDNKQNTMLYNLVIEVLKQNKDLVAEVCKSNPNPTNTIAIPQNSIVATTTTNDSHNSHNNIQNNLVDSYNTTNNQNNTFNLQVFLNEKCKNAMNIMDFVDSLEPQLSDLESIGRLGFVNGLSNIIIKNLKALDVTMRPVHCNDSKRETVYVKDNDEWEKDDENKSKLRKAVKYIAHKNVKLVPQWKAKYPDYLDSSSANSDKYNNMVIEVLGGDDDSNVSENKIMKKIVKEVVIDKNIKL